MAQTASIARCKMTSRGTQNHSFDPAPMSLPEQLRDRAAHRVPDGNESADVEGFRECRNVICTIRESEGGSDPHPASVATMIDDQDAVGPPEGLENRSPIE